MAAVPHGFFYTARCAMKRSTTAFIVAPLWVPLLAVAYTLYLSLRHVGPVVWAHAAVLSIFAYIVVFALVSAVFRWLWSRGWTAGRTAAVVGAALAVLTCMAAVLSFNLASGAELRGPTLADFLRSEFLLFVLMAPGLVGALVGATIWLIARPDLSQGRGGRRLRP
jgi:hypothetical protein